MKTRAASLRRPMGSLESDVLATLWASDEALTPNQVLQALSTDLAYTTVLTVLTRLTDKGVVRREPTGRTFRYTPLVSEGELAANKMQAALAAVHDRDAALSHFVQELSAKDVKALRAFLNRGRNA